MLLKKLGLLVGISSLLVACGPDCVSMCEKAQDDGDCFVEVDLTTGDTDDLDCEDYCEDVEAIAAEEEGDCEEDLDTLLECMDEEEDACDALSEDCEGELDNLSECLSEHCADNPNDNACEDLLGG